MQANGRGTSGDCLHRADHVVRARGHVALRRAHRPPLLGGRRDRVGLGTTILGLLVLGATCIAGRGSRMGRAFIGLLTGFLTVAGVIYMFKGPTSAIFPSIIVAGISAGTFALLFLPESSKRFYAEA